MKIAERELASPGDRARPRLFLDPVDNISRARQRLIKLIHAKEQQEAIPRLRPVGTAASNVSDADDRPCALHPVFLRLRD